MAPSRPRSRSRAPRAVEVTAALVRKLRLEQPEADDSKEDRGRVLIIGGSREVPGALRLAAEAALQAGGGKLHIATVASVAPMLALVVPEARVTGLPESRSGEIKPASAVRLHDFVAESDAVLVGPGMLDSNNAAELVDRLRRDEGARWVLDAAAIGDCRTRKASRAAAPTVITPHHGEMLRLLGQLGVDATDDATQVAGHWAHRVSLACQCVTVLKGATTWIADPGKAIYRHTARLPGLGTSGSGDVLAGLIAGLAAREPDLLRCAIWAVHVHAQAGAALARRRGAIGFLAREIAGEIPGLLDRK